MEELPIYGFYSERIDICSRHIFGVCQNCIPDEKNQYCPNYKPIIIHVKKEDIQRDVTPSIDNKL